MVGSQNCHDLVACQVLWGTRCPLLDANQWQMGRESNRLQGTYGQTSSLLCLYIEIFLFRFGGERWESKKEGPPKMAKDTRSVTGRSKTDDVSQYKTGSDK
jgi:hypothetical protein